VCSYSCLKSGWEILFQVRINRSLTASGRVYPSHPRHRYWACWRPLLHRQLSDLTPPQRWSSAGSDRVERSHGEIPATLRPITSQSFLPDQSHLSARSCMKTKWRRNSKRSYYPQQSFPSPSNPTTSRRTSCEACTQLWRGVHRDIWEPNRNGGENYVVQSSLKSASLVPWPLHTSSFWSLMLASDNWV